MPAGSPTTGRSALVVTEGTDSGRDSWHPARVRRNQPLNDRQVQVLRRIGQGCPDGTWRDFTYKTTALALAARGLVTVDKRRNTWNAGLTDTGQFYLRHGKFSTDSVSASDLASGSGSDIETLAAELLQQLLTRNGKVTVEGPADRQRAQFRRAIHHLITHHEIPDGFLLRHSGRDQGDLTIRLLRETDAPKTEPAPNVRVADADGEVSPEVRDLTARMQMAVTEPTIPRARQILQAIANENGKRGWTMDIDPHDDRRFTITTPECSFDLALREELVNAELPDTDTLSAAKYPWQRVPMKVHKVGSGRLTLQLGQYYRARTWSDRTRWRLDDKLGAVFVELDNRVAAAAEERRVREADLLRRQQAWDHPAYLAQ